MTQRWIVLTLVTAAATALGQARPNRAAGPATQQHAPASAPSSRSGDNLSITEGSVTVAGQTVRYRATTGTLQMKDEVDKPKANFFFVAYERLAPTSEASTHPATTTTTPTTTTAQPVATRPVTFVFNGGPGAASVWLHLGTAGPRRLLLNDDGSPPPPPYRLVDNDFTWLDATDLVFIDPVGTGFSRAAAGEDAKQFFGVQEDISSVADFIRLYCSRYGRWSSPKFLAGESYGTTRSAGLSEYLLDRYGIALNGIVLISTVLDFQTIMLAQANDLPYVLYLPSYTATALYHKKLAPELQNDPKGTVDEAKTFALGEYTAALAHGSSLNADDRKRVIDRLVRLTGLPADLIDKSNLRIDPGFFEKNLLGGRRLVGRFDSRIAGYALDPTNDSAEYDPSFAPYFAGYSSTFNDYVRRTLGYESDLPYEVLTGRVQPWNYGRSGTGFLSTSDNLRNAITKNPNLHVLVCSGYYDLATPFLATDYTVSHMGLAPELQKNVQQAYYGGGHMVYHVTSMGMKLREDVVNFIRATLPAQEP
jgi:carboxypeptidase C (cathepsin A)